MIQGREGGKGGVGRGRGGVWGGGKPCGALQGHKTVEGLRSFLAEGSCPGVVSGGERNAGRVPQSPHEQAANSGVESGTRHSVAGIPQQHRKSACSCGLYHRGPAIGGLQKPYQSPDEGLGMYRCRGVVVMRGTGNCTAKFGGSVPKEPRCPVRRCLHPMPIPNWSKSWQAQPQSCTVQYSSRTAVARRP